MLVRLRTLEARLLPHGVFDVMRQLVLFSAAYWCYRIVRGAVDGRASDAFQHGRELISLERTLHTFVEPAIQGWASGKTWLIDAASWLYVNSQFSITLGALVAMVAAYAAELLARTRPQAWAFAQMRAEAAA